MLYAKPLQFGLMLFELSNYGAALSFSQIGALCK